MAGVVALVLPPFLVTNCWLDALGANGWLHRILPLNIYSLGGAVWVLALLTWPITTLASLSAWQRLDASHLEADPALGGWALVRWLLWPVARNAVSLGAVLTFVLALNNFAVPTILQVKVFPSEAWVRYYNQLDIAGALAVSWPMILAPVFLLLILRPSEVSWPATERVSRRLRQQLGEGWWKGCGVGGLVVMVVSLALPLGEMMLNAGTWRELPQVLRAVPGTVWNSFWLSALAATACLGLGLTTWRWRAGRWMWILFLVPGTLLGIGMIWVFNRPALGMVIGSIWMVVVCWTLRYVPLAWEGVRRAMLGVERDLVDAARLEGARGWAMVREIQWPLIGPQAAVAWYFTYLLCLWDVETLILVVPAGRETLALRIFNLLHYGHNVQVNALCLLLLGLAVLPLVAARVLKAVMGRDND